MATGLVAVAYRPNPDAQEALRPGAGLAEARPLPVTYRSHLNRQGPSDMTKPPPHRSPDTPVSLEAGIHDGIAVTSDHLATNAAIAMLRRGGNAVDAAIAANAMLAVVRPDTCGPGGDLFALVHQPDTEEPGALNASGRAGSGSSAAQLRSAGHDVVPLHGPASVTVPGCVDGWEALLGRFGTLPMKDVLAPAVATAVDGFAASPELAMSLGTIAAMLRDQDSARDLYPGGAIPGAGDMLTRASLAATLSEVGNHGRSSFYEGTVGEAITAVTGGVITRGDLVENQAEWVTPLQMEVHGVDAWTIPPNSQGHLALTASWLAERLPLDGDLGSAAYHHALIEAYRAVAWERDLVTTDPGTAPLAPADLVSPARLDARLSRIRPDATTPWPSSRSVPGGTTYLCVRDSAGMGISLIQSNFHGIGSGVGAGATGVFLHNRGAGFTLEPGHRNELMAGRRPLHTLAPTLWTSEGSLRLLLGTRGGQYQPQLLVQIAAHRFAAGLPLDVALAAPRWIVDHWGPDESHVVTVEERMGDEVIAGLRQRGHTVVIADPWQRGWGPVAAIEVTSEKVTGAGDPRVSTSGAAAT
jgi:gamma-glutamyltranspeptidase/glutathione hydrolase